MSTYPREPLRRASIGRVSNWRPGGVLGTLLTVACLSVVGACSESPTGPGQASDGGTVDGGAAPITGGPGSSTHPQPAPAPPPPPDPGSAGRILIDASHDGGVWWFPQAGPVFLADQQHQGRALAEYLRSRGYEVDELGRNQLVSKSLLSEYRYVIRAGEWGPYSAQELAAYRSFVEREVTLLLLSDHRKTDSRDELGEMLGITFSGVIYGTITRLAEHPITEHVTSVRWIAGAEVTAFDPDETEILGWVNDSVPVMGVLKSHPAKIFFIGDTNGLEQVPQPLVDNLIEWGF
jgi:hypothetical protein